MTYEQYMRARQLLAEEQVGVALRRQGYEEEAQWQSSLSALERDSR